MCHLYQKDRAALTRGPHPWLSPSTSIEEVYDCGRVAENIVGIPRHIQTVSRVDSNDLDGLKRGGLLNTVPLLTAVNLCLVVDLFPAANALRHEGLLRVQAMTNSRAASSCQLPRFPPWSIRY